ncbi:hypothetical protein H4R24_004150 [Coemansia sp. RSA 988]|nr:hypothetical protein H4R24_004150 [Coemansia sp. RSA 988]
MLRILAATEGSQFGIQPDRMYPVLMMEPGQYDEDVFAGLDWFLAQLPKFNMTATISLSNYWTWSGGIAQYVSWITDTKIPYPKQWDHLRQIFSGGNYEAFLDYTNHFYADTSIYNTVQRLFKSHIKAVVGRRNTVNGIYYRDDPVIMAWELMNEPQVIAGRNGQDQLFRWIDDSARFIHSLDPHHLITTGAESKNGPEWFKVMHKSRHISLASCHFWPLNWGYYNSTDPTNASIDYSISKMRDFVDDNAHWARDMAIPVVLFEFGMMRDNWGNFSGLAGYDPQAPVTHRNIFYTAVVERITELANDGVFAGAAFWAYAGSARPPSKPTTKIVWTGDPPHEPPGWNSVYNDDEETLNIISMLGQRFCLIKEDI